MFVYKMRIVILLATIICSIILSQFPNFLTSFPFSDDSYYHGAAAFSIPHVQRIDQSLYDYYIYPITFIFGGLLYEISHLDGLVLLKMYYFFVSFYIALIGFLIGKLLFKDSSLAILNSILTVSSSYYFPKWFSPFSLSSIFTLTVLYGFLVLSVEHSFAWLSVILLLITTCTLTHLGNSTFLLLYFLVVLSLILLKGWIDSKRRIQRNTRYLRIPTNVIIFSFILYLSWNLFINDFQMTRLLKDIVNTIMNPPVEDVVQIFTTVYFKKYDLLSVLRRIYILSIPSIGSLGALYWVLQGRRRSSIHSGMFLTLFVAQVFFIMLNVSDYFVRTAFFEGLGIAGRVRWLLYLVSSWWVTDLVIDLKNYLLKLIERKLSDSLVKKTFPAILISILLLPEMLYFYVNFEDSAGSVVSYRDIRFNIYFSRFVFTNSSLFGYTTHNNVLFYYLTMLHGIQEAHQIVRKHLISMYEAVYAYQYGSLSSVLKQMNVLIAVDKMRALSFYPGYERMVEAVFSSFNAEKSAVIFNDGDHKVFLKEGG